VTVGCLTVPRGSLGLRRHGIDANGRITSFLEKPKDPPGTPDDPTVTLASMGIYVFKWTFLRELLRATRTTRIRATTSAATSSPTS
jgi:glucose-1-phosphate adenylyltransferase